MLRPIANRIGSSMSRRAFAQSLAGVALAQACHAAESNSPGELTWNIQTPPALNAERRYRADAQVLLFGVPLLRREGVGGGSVVWREFNAASTVRFLEFTGFSLPERAAGLNRMGFIREMSRAAGKDAAESIYFGLMTASPEESAEEARKALHSDTKQQIYSAIEGRISAGQTATAIAHFTAASGENRGQLVEHARRALASAAKVRTADPAPASSRSFLQELAGLLLRPDGAEARYVYAGRPYRMRLVRSVDRKVSAHFRERRLIPASMELIRVTGRLRRETGGKETEFRLWIPGGADRPLPLRIEYQAKSYLRLVFDATAG